MGQVMTAPRRERVVPSKLPAGRVCANAALSGGVRPLSPSGAPSRGPGCDRARSKVVQPELPNVSGTSAMFTALLLVAIGFGVLWLGSWRQSSVSEAPQEQSAVAHVAGIEGPGHE